MLETLENRTINVLNNSTVSVNRELKLVVAAAKPVSDSDVLKLFVKISRMLLRWKEVLLVNKKKAAWDSVDLTLRPRQLVPVVLVVLPCSPEALVPEKIPVQDLLKEETLEALVALAVLVALPCSPEVVTTPVEELPPEPVAADLNLELVALDLSLLKEVVSAKAVSTEND
jgi:hypothetical protein